MKKFSAILFASKAGRASFACASLVLGIGVFIAAVTAATPNPILRATEDSAVRIADFIAPSTQAMTTPSDSIYTIGEVRIVGGGQNTNSHATGQAHVQRTAQDSADNTAELNIEGLFSTQAARDYNPAKYHNKAPNVRYVKPACPLCSR